jgi:hypothetical protein
MRAYEAADLVAGTIFKPGWRFSARPRGTLVQVELDIDTVNTSYPGPDGRYRVPLSTYDEKLLNVDGMDEEDLCYELLKMAAGKDSHENREFLRVRRGGRWVAPLRPHTDQGIRAWARRS